MTKRIAIFSFSGRRDIFGMVQIVEEDAEGYCRAVILDERNNRVSVGRWSRPRGRGSLLARAIER